MKRRTERPASLGLKTPNVVYFVLGLIHSKLMHRAEIAAETGKLRSTYAARKYKLFDQHMAFQEKELENRTKSAWMEAMVLLASVPDGWGDSSDPRTAKRERGLREQTTLRLTEISQSIQSSELQAREQVRSTAARLQSRLLAYCHGVALTPVSEDVLPPLRLEFTDYQAAHEDNTHKLADYLGRE